MIDTLMALWNRSLRDRAIVIILLFFVICISISLLLITAYGAGWTSWPQWGQVARSNKGVKSAYLTATVPPISPTTTKAPTSIVKAAPTNTPNPCVATPTIVETSPLPASPTVYRGKPPIVPTATILHPTPTLPPVRTPRVTPTPSPTMTITVTPTPARTPTSTPTPGKTPTSTPTPQGTPTGTPTVVVRPIVTPTPSETQTYKPIVTTVATTPAVSAKSRPHASARMSATPTSLPADKLHIVTQRNGEPMGTSCLEDSVEVISNAAISDTLKWYIWIILLSSAIGTMIFCGVIYRAARRKRL